MTVTLTAICPVLGYVRHIEIYSRRVHCFVALWFGRVVAVHGPLTLAVEGAVHRKIGTSLHHRSSAGPDDTGFLT